MKRTQYTAEFKSEAVKQVVDKGHSVVDVAKRLGIGESLLYGWVRKSAQSEQPLGGDIKCLQDEVSKLKAELRRTTEEHTLHVTFSEATQRVINAIREAKRFPANNGNDLNETPESTCEARSKDQGNVMGKSPEALQANPDDIVRLFGDGGVKKPTHRNGMYGRSLGCIDRNRSIQHRQVSQCHLLDRQ